MYCLDTDIISYFFRGEKSIVSKITTTPLNEISTTIINYSELKFGAYSNSNKREVLLQTIAEFLKDIAILEYDAQSADIFAHQKADLKKRGMLIADLDLMIASICIAKDII